MRRASLRRHGQVALPGAPAEWLRARARRARRDARLRALCLGLLQGVLLVDVGWALRDEDVRAPVVWRSLSSSGLRSARPVALARSPSGRGLAVGDEAGITWLRGDRSERAALVGVRDLVFDAEERLWIASESGLHLWRPDGRPERRTLPGGTAANRIHRLASDGRSLLLATDGGAFWSSQGRVFQALPLPGTATPATQVAVRPAHLDLDAGLPGLPGLPVVRRAQAWIYASGRLSRVRGVVGDSGLRVTDVRVLAAPRLADGRSPVDLEVDPDGRRLFVVFEDLLAWRALDDLEETSVGSSWRSLRPVLPPGARIRRLGWAAGRVWLATDHGLLEAFDLDADFRRTTSPIGSGDCADLQPLGRGGVVALCRSGVYVRHESTPEPDPSSAWRRAPTAPVASRLPPDPPVSEIRRRALKRAGLVPSRSHSLWEGLRRRALWPELSLRFGMDLDRDEQRDADQSFVSGAMRSLLDRTRDEGVGYDASIELDWDLGGVAYPEDSVDLSRELRQVVSLRDDVADEIHQLYFERQSIRERLDGSAPLDPAEAMRLELRAREIDAGLDAWTGGWVSRWRIARAASRGRGATPGTPDRPPDPPAFESGPGHPANKEIDP